MSDKGILITGAGGFLGRFVVDRYLNETEHALYLLEHGPFLDKLRDHIRKVHPHAEDSGRAVIFSGDITQPGLGLDDALRATLKEKVTGVLHFAALYHLAAPRDVLMRINVEGTRHLLDFCQQLPRFERLGHISTLAVAGTHQGVFDETDFDKGQSFKNFYEETKFLSEKLVRERMNDLPAVIFRPPVVVGHSKTGYIEKVDGPYYLLTAISRNMNWITPDCGEVKCHIGPVDYVTDGIFMVFEHDPGAVGTLCSLMDPNPVTYNQFFDLACEHWPKRKPILRPPFKLLKPLARSSLFEMLAGIPWQAFQYGDQPIEYPLPESTRRLNALGLTCPRLPEYIGNLVAYFKAHLTDQKIRRGNWRNILNP